MNKRKSEILLSLVENANKAISIAKLAEEYHLSEKTIRNDIKDINHFLESHQYDTIQLLGNGNVQFLGNVKDIMCFLKNNNFYTYKLEKNEREQVIALLLIQSKGFITISSIANQLFVSRATLLNDLKSIRRLFEENQLKIISSPNKGLLIEGSEASKRMLIYQIFSIRYQAKGSMQTCFNSYESTLLHWYEDTELKRVLEKIIIETENFFNIGLTDGSFDKLLFYLMLAIKRIQNGFTVSDICVEGESWNEVAKDILKKISQYCDIEVNEQEIKLLSNLFLDLKYLKTRNQNTKIVTLQIITRKFIEEVSNELHIDLNGDYLFFEKLVNHLESFEQRGNASLPFEDVFVGGSKPLEVFAAVNKHIPILQKAIKHNFNETELYFVVIHICAAIERKKNNSTKIQVVTVCSGGVGTSQLISARIKNYFHFKVLETIAGHELDGYLKQNQQNVDLIISTIPLQHVPVDYVVVSPNLTGSDILNIYDKVDKIKKDHIQEDMQESSSKDPQFLIDEIIKVTQKYVKKEFQQYSQDVMKVVNEFFKKENHVPYLSQLLQPEHIQVDVECDSYEEAIRQSAKTLLDHGFIEDRYIKAMIQSVKKYGPYIVISDGFAVPHAAIDDGGNRVGMNLIRLKKPVDFLGKSVNYVCSLSVVDAKKHLNAFFHLVNSLQIPEFKAQLDSAKTPEDMATVIWNFENQIGTTL